MIDAMRIIFLIFHLFVYKLNVRLINCINNMAVHISTYNFNSHVDSRVNRCGLFCYDLK